jgi:hypothetical protein
MKRESFERAFASLSPASLPTPTCRFPSTELYKGSGALVQMQSVDQAAAAIQALNGSFPRGAAQPLLVRYADSPGMWCRCGVTALSGRAGGAGRLHQEALPPTLAAEKAAKQARKERLMQKQASSTSSLLGTNTLLAAQLQQQLLGLVSVGPCVRAGGSISTNVPGLGLLGWLSQQLPVDPLPPPALQAMSSSGRQLQLSSGITGSPDLPGDLPTMLSMDGFSDSSGSLTTASSAVLGQQPPVLGPPHGVGPGGASSLYIKGMPEDADKLWLYEKFARCVCGGGGGGGWGGGGGGGWAARGDVAAKQARPSASCWLEPLPSVLSRLFLATHVLIRPHAATLAGLGASTACAS